MTAFNVSGLQVLSYSGSSIATVPGFTLWHYPAHRLGACLRDVAADGFFNAACDMMAVGDMLLISATDGAAIAYVVLTAPDHVVAEVRPLVGIVPFGAPGGAA